MERYTFEIKNGVYRQPQYDYRMVNKNPNPNMAPWPHGEFVFTGYKVFFAFFDANDPYKHPYKIEADKFNDWKKENPDIFIRFGFYTDIPKERIAMFDEIEDNGGQQYSGTDCGCVYASTTLID